SAGANRDDRLMTDEHQRTLRLNLRQALLDGGDLQLNLRDQPAGFCLAIYSRPHFFDAGFDFLQRIVADQQHQVAHRIQRANLPHVRREFKPDYQRGPERDDRFDVRRQKRAYPRQIAHLWRVVAILRDADDVGARPQREQSFRDTRRQRYDSHPSGRVGRRGERQCIQAERGGGRESIRTHIAKLPDRTGAGKRPSRFCCILVTPSTSLVGTRSIAVLKIAVCIKQIPLIEEASFDAATRTIRRDGPSVISAFDLRAISLAVDLKNRHGAETTVITMGPPQARDALVDALAMGMDRAVHLEDRAFAGADTLATARALARWLARGNFDLIMLGKYSLDAETGQVG